MELKTGEFQTSESLANIRIVEVIPKGLIQLRIDNQAFYKKDIEDFIQFLMVVRQVNWPDD